MQTATYPPDSIVNTIISAITEGRLAPGTKLAEERLCGLFGVSRTLVRQALQQLALQGLVNLLPSRGAYVATPSIEEARQVFAVRRMLEVQFIREFTSTITHGDIATLRDHLASERAAIESNDVPSRTRLLADFHIEIARLQGNAVLAQLLSELTARCQLITLMYQSNTAAQASSDEHAQLLEAMTRGDSEEAAQLMDAHLRHVEQGLRPRASATANLDLAILPTHFSANPTELRSTKTQGSAS